MLIKRENQSETASIPMNSIDIYTNAHVKSRHAKNHDYNGNVTYHKANSGKYCICKVIIRVYRILLGSMVI